MQGPIKMKRTEDGTGKSISLLHILVQQAMKGEADI